MIITAAMYVVGTSGAGDDDVAGDDVEGRSTAPQDSAPTTFPAPATAAPVPLGGTSLAGLSFSDVTAAAGLSAPHADRPLTSGEVMNGAAAAGDYDGDGDIDLVLTRVGLPNLLYRNDGSGTFTDEAAAAGVAEPVPPVGSGTPLLADVDGDSDLDLLLTGNPTGGRALKLNNGDGTFTDATAGSGLELIPDEAARPQSFGASFADWDHDGDLDLTVLQWFVDPLDGSQAAEAAVGTEGMCERTAALRAAGGAGDLAGPELVTRSAMYRNQGDGTFADVTAESGVDMEEIVGFTPLFSDIDGDGWEDLLITGDLCTSRIYRNDAGRGFMDVTAESGVGTDENGTGSVVEDIDGDGNLDWFVTSIAYPTADGVCPFDGSTIGCTGNRLFLGDGRGGFRDATAQYGLRDGYRGWGAAAQDFNNDGFRDIAMVNGYDPNTGSGGESDPVFARFVSDPSLLWLGREETPLPEVGAQVGFGDTASGKALVPFDMDADGDLDIIVANTSEPPILYRNDTPPGGNWLTVRLRDVGPNPFAVGARVLVRTSDSDVARPAEVRAGSSYEGSDPYDLHFGLGPGVTVESVDVLWPGSRDPQVVEGPAVNQLLELRRGS
ncbi:MAG: CRTAC1 family protein [Actinomycetia bacterium]|nr:CRTAC1 family protein [Actinomycetes bacterium]